MTEIVERTGREHWLSYAKLMIVMILWSGNFIVGRAVHGVIPPFTLALVRWTGAALILLPFAWRPVQRDWPILRAHWKIVLLLAFTGVAAFNAFIYSGLNFTTATNGMLLEAAVPALVLVFNAILFRMTAPRLEIAGVALSMIGVVVVVLRGDLAAALNLQFNIGDILVICGVICWSLYTCLLRLRPPCHPLALLLTTFTIGVIAMAPFSALELAANPSSLQLGWGATGAFAYVAIFPSLIAYILYNDAVHDLGAGPAGQMITMMPLFGALLALIVLGETLHGFHAAGMVLILGGITLGAIVVSRSRA